MKFSDGFWRQAPGLQTIHPLEVRDVKIATDHVTLFVPTRPITNRRNTLNNPVAEVTFTAPADGILGVRIVHFSGVRDTGARFVLTVDPAAALGVERRPDVLIVSSGQLSAEISLSGELAIVFKRAGEALTETGRRAIGIARSDAGESFLFQRLGLPHGDQIYGLGERSTPLTKNGQSIDTWNDDGGPSSWHSYKAVPFFMSQRGWGVLVNSPGRVSFEVGSEFPSQVQFSLPGQSLEYFLIADETPKGVLKRYTGLTGRPPVPPRWSFGLWLSTSFVTDYDEKTVDEFVTGMEQRQLPFSVVHFDTFWMREFHWCDFEWDPAAFPDPQGMLARLHARGLRCSVWINPYIAQRSRLFAEARDRGFLLRRPNGDVWQWDTWQAGMGFVDFTNPEARAWFAGRLRTLLEMGVDCFKTDFGERLPLDAIYHDGSDPSKMHNYYSYLYNETVFSVLAEVRGKDAVVFARSATVGGQKFPVHWGGDPEPTYVSMAETLRSGLSLALSGFGFWSHDIGGFEGEPSPDLFMRWAAFGLLSSHSRLHGSISHRVPWRFGDRAVEVVRKFTRLKMRLMPYLHAAALAAHESGLPVMRPMVLEFPDDPTCLHLDRQYMLGDDLLVAPVMRPNGTVQYYVPEGTWTELLTSRPVEGPGWRSERHDHDSLPLLVRPGAVIAMGAREDLPDYDYRDHIRIAIFGGAFVDRECKLVVAGPADEEPARFHVVMRSGTITVRGASPLPWEVFVVGHSTPFEISGARTEGAEGGVLLVPTSADSVVRIQLRDGR